jgi:hypothetical protein
MILTRMMRSPECERVSSFKRSLLVRSGPTQCGAWLSTCSQRETSSSDTDEKVWGVFLALEQQLQKQGDAHGAREASDETEARMRVQEAQTTSEEKLACHMRRSIKGQLAQTTSSSTLCKDVRKVLSRPARLPLPHALIRSARGGGGGGGGEVGGGSPGPVPTASRALRPGQKEAMGAATPPALPMSRRENWPGPLLRARLDLPRSSRRLPELVYLIALRLSLFSLFL